jgi:hypothetical protein
MQQGGHSTEGWYFSVSSAQQSSSAIDMQRERAAVVHRARLTSSEARIGTRATPLGTFGLPNEIVLSHEFFNEIMSHPIQSTWRRRGALRSPPLSICPCGLSMLHGQGRERCRCLETSLVNQLGSSDYARPRKFRERLEGWFDLVRSMRLSPVAMDTTGTGCRMFAVVLRREALMYNRATNWNLGTITGANQPRSRIISVMDVPGNQCVFRGNPNTIPG